MPPVQAGASQGFWVNSRQQRLLTRTYKPQGRPKAVLLWHHGFGEHGGRYQRTHTEWAASGIETHSYDVHGHGESEPKAESERALILDYNHLVGDLVDFAQQVQSQSAGVPMFVGGQSMGGMVSCLAALRRPDLFAGLLLCSAAIDVERTLVMRLQEPFGGLLSRFVPRARLVPAIPIEALSLDTAVVQDFIDDPLTFKGSMRVRSATELVRGFADIWEHRGGLRMPLYAQHGNADKITSCKAAKELVDAVSSTDKEFVEVPGAYHELLNGSGSQEFHDRIAQWILARCQPSKL